MSAEQTPDIADVLADLIADDPMWIGDDGQPLDYLPERESRIADFVAAAEAALAPLLAAAVREAEQRALREHREEWASYIENWDGAVGPEPPTVAGIIAALRGPVPFGCAAADRITEPVSHEAATSGEEASKA